MAGASQGYHEEEKVVSSRTKDLHRALVSLQEELEAIDWYQQRADATEDPQLREILEHNRDEEKEHAMMLLEWIRRHDVAFARMMKRHTGHAGPIVTEEDEAEASGATRAQEQPDEAAPARQRVPTAERGSAPGADLERAPGTADVEGRVAPRGER